MLLLWPMWIRPTSMSLCVVFVSSVPAAAQDDVKEIGGRPCIIPYHFSLLFFNFSISLLFLNSPSASSQAILNCFSSCILIWFVMATLAIHGLKNTLEADLISIAISMAILAATLYWFVFRITTVENYLAPLLWFYLVAMSIVGSAYFTIANFSILQTLFRLTVVVTSFNGSLILSIAVYRLFFHRIRRFPGPLWSKLGRFADVALAAKEVKYYREVATMRETYGDFIRTGKCILFIFSPAFEFSQHEIYQHLNRPPRNLHRTQICRFTYLWPTIFVLEDNLVCPSVSKS